MKPIIKKQPNLNHGPFPKGIMGLCMWCYPNLPNPTRKNTQSL